MDGEPCVWLKDSIFDDEVEPIPDQILQEVELKTGTVEELSAKKVGGKQRKATPRPKVTKASSSDNNKKAEVKGKKGSKRKRRSL